jgi:hypothetical protein
MNTYEKEKLRAMLTSFEETIDEVVIFDVIHPFPDVKPPRYSTYRSRSKKTSSPTPSIAANTPEPFSHDRASLSKALLLDYKQITNTLSCSHEDRACTCVSLNFKTTTSKVNILESIVSKCKKRPKVSSRSFTAFPVILTGSLPKKKESSLH